MKTYYIVLLFNYKITDKCGCECLSHNILSLRGGLLLCYGFPCYDFPDGLDDLR